MAGTLMEPSQTKTLLAKIIGWRVVCPGKNLPIEYPHSFIPEPLGHRLAVFADVFVNKSKLLSIIWATAYQSPGPTSSDGSSSCLAHWYWASKLHYRRLSDFAKIAANFLTAFFASNRLSTWRRLPRAC